VRLRGLDGAPSSATVRQLLTHTAGLPRGSGLRHYTGPVPAAGELFADGIRAEGPAGQWSYSNLGFVALAALAADVLGAPFGECLRTWVMGAGELVASARDAAALAAAAVNGQLLSAESARELLAPYARCGPDTWQGLGVRIEHHGPVRLAGHGGTFPGFDAAAWGCPETGESAALLANTNTGLLQHQLRIVLLPEI
jgi:beta-lactamase family protein